MKLTDADVRLIRELAKYYTHGLHKLLAREFRVSAWYISRILSGAAR